MPKKSKNIKVVEGTDIYKGLGERKPCNYCMLTKPVHNKIAKQMEDIDMKKKTPPKYQLIECLLMEKNLKKINIKYLYYYIIKNV